jgi:aconitate hydratase
LGLAEFTLSRKDPEYVSKAKEVAAAEAARIKARDPRDEYPELKEVFEKINVEIKTTNPLKVGIGSLIYAVKPGRWFCKGAGSIMSESVRRLGKYCQEYATKNIVQILLTGECFLLYSRKKHFRLKKEITFLFRI